MKNLIKILAIVALLALVLSGCNKDNPQPNVSGGISVGVNSNGGIWINAGIGIGFGGGYYFPSFNPNNRWPLQNSFVLYVLSAPDALATKTGVFMINGRIAIDPATGQQMTVANFSGNALRKYLNTWDYNKGPAPVLIQRESMPNRQDFNGAYIYDYNII